MGIFCGGLFLWMIGGPDRGATVAVRASSLVGGISFPKWEWNEQEESWSFPFIVHPSRSCLAASPMAEIADSSLLTRLLLLPQAFVSSLGILT